METSSMSVHKFGINSRSCEIQRVLLNDELVNFELTEVDREILRNVEQSAESINSHPSHFGHSILKDYSASFSRPELIIEIPGASIEEQESIRKFTVEVYFIKRNLRSFFNICDFKRTNYYHLHPPSDMARFWFPCIDAINVKHAWDLAFVYPKKFGDLNLTMVSSGMLLKEVELSDSSKKMSIFQQSIPIAAGKIGFILGTFEKQVIKESPPRMAYCLKEKMSKLNSTLEIVNKIFDFYSWFLNFQYPFASFSIAFSHDIGDYLQYANLVIIDQKYLYDHSLIDQAIQTRDVLCAIISSQFFGLYVTPESLADYWVTSGISVYCARECQRIFHGHNDYRFKLKKDIERICFMDVNQPPIYYEDVDSLFDLNTEFISKKSSLVFFLLEQHLSKAFVQKIIMSLLEDCNLGEIPKGVSTNYFLRIVKKTSGKDLKDFAEKWIFSSGIPSVHCSFSINRKSSVIEFCMKQSNPSNHSHGLTKFVGPITVRVHEAEGVYDHVIQFDDYSFRGNLPFHTKFKKGKKKIKKDTENGEEEDDEEPPEEDVADEGRDLDEEDLMSINSPISWIQIDPEMEWLMTLTIDQPDFMWIEQLENDREVLSQYDAVIALDRFPSEASCFALERIIGDWKVFHKVRQEAAYSLATCGLKKLNFIGTQKLIQIFSKKYCFQESKASNVIKPNNFEQFPNYFIQKAIPLALSLSRDEESPVPEPVISFILSLLRYNDNTKNQFNDNFYISSLVETLAFAISGSNNQVHTDLQLVKSCLDEIERYRLLDLLFPSYRNVVSVSCIRALARIASSGVISIDKNILLQYCKFDNYWEVRKAAFESLLLLYPADESLFQLIINRAEIDDSTLMKHLLWNMIEQILQVNFSKCESFNPVSKEFYWNLLKRQMNDPRFIKQALHIGCYLFKAMDCTMDESTIKPSFVIPTVPVSKMVEMKRDDLHDLGSSDEEIDTEPVDILSVDHGKLFEDSVPKEVKSPIKVVLKPKVVVEKPKISLPSVKKPEVKLRLSLTPSLPKVKQEEIIPIVTDLSVEAEKPIIPVKLKVSKPKPVFINFENDVDLEEKTKIKPVIKLKAFHKEESEMEFAKRILRKLKESKGSVYFNTPVDPIKLNIPIYLEIIKHPMDFSTIEKKLKAEEYATLEQFENDVLLVFRNCFTFNQLDGEIYKAGRRLQQQFVKDMLSRPFDKPISIRKITEETRFLSEKFVNDLMNDPLAGPFIDPVDPIALNLPKYPDIVLRPMDLSFILNGIQENRYVSAEFIKMDVLQVFTNCKDFNVEGSTIYQFAVELEEKFMNSWNDNIEPLLENTESLCMNDLFVEMIDELISNPHSIAFREPVDHVALNLPNYPKIVKSPMDLSTVKKNISNCSYKVPISFGEDVMLIFKNCYLFNGFTAPISQSARILETNFVQKFNAFFPLFPISLSDLKKKK